MLKKSFLFEKNNLFHFLFNNFLYWILFDQLFVNLKLVDHKVAFEEMHLNPKYDPSKIADPW